MLKAKNAYAPLIDEYFSRRENVVVCVWNEAQRIPAGVYVRSAVERYPLGDATILVTGDQTLFNGMKLDGRTVIRYHYTGGSSGGGR